MWSRHNFSAIVPLIVPSSSPLFETLCQSCLNSMKRFGPAVILTARTILDLFHYPAVCHLLLNGDIKQLYGTSKTSSGRWRSIKLRWSPALSKRDPQPAQLVTSARACTPDQPPSGCRLRISPHGPRHAGADSLGPRSGTPPQLAKTACLSFKPYAITPRESPPSFRRQGDYRARVGLRTRMGLRDDPCGRHALHERWIFAAQYCSPEERLQRNHVSEVRRRGWAQSV